MENFAEESPAVGQISAASYRLLHLAVNLFSWVLDLVLLTEQHLVQEGMRRTLELHVCRLLHEDGGVASGSDGGQRLRAHGSSLVGRADHSAAFEVLGISPSVLDGLLLL